MNMSFPEMQKQGQQHGVGLKAGYPQIYWLNHMFFLKVIVYHSISMYIPCLDIPSDI
jgi:hypothetical protein